MQIKLPQEGQEKQGFDKLFQLLEQQNQQIQSLQSYNEYQIKNTESTINKIQLNMNYINQPTFKEVLKSQVVYSNQKQQLVKNLEKGIVHIKSLKQLKQAKLEGYQIKSIFIDIVNLGPYLFSFSEEDKQLQFQEIIQDMHELAIMGDAITQFSLSFLYLNGDKGIDKNYETALMWAKKSYNQGFNPASYILGICAKNGYGITQNTQQAYQHFKQKQSLLRDIITEIKYQQTELIDQQIYVPNQYEVGLCLYYGLGVKEKDCEKGIQIIQQCSQQNYYEAHLFLANLYRKGEYYGKSIEKAIYHYEQAAQLSSLQALNSLIEIYEQNKDGKQSQFLYHPKTVQLKKKAIQIYRMQNKSSIQQ